MLVMSELYGASIQGPDLLTTIHWRMSDISKAIDKLTSEATALYEFRVVEVSPAEAMEDHNRICDTCRSVVNLGNPPVPQTDSRCFARKRLEETLKKVHQ
jgi:hypothetical protein